MSALGRIEDAATASMQLAEEIRQREETQRAMDLQLEEERRRTTPPVIASQTSPPAVMRTEERALQEMVAEMQAQPPERRRRLRRTVRIGRRRVRITLHPDGRVEVKPVRRRGLFGALGGLINKIAPVLSIASVAVPALAPVGGFLRVANSVQKLQQGDLLGSLTSFASGKGGVAEKLARSREALEAASRSLARGDLGGVISSVAGGAANFSQGDAAALARRIESGVATMSDGFRLLVVGDVVRGAGAAASGFGTLVGGDVARLGQEVAGAASQVRTVGSVLGGVRP